MKEELTKHDKALFEHRLQIKSLSDDMQDIKVIVKDSLVETRNISVLLVQQQSILSKLTTIESDRRTADTKLQKTQESCSKITIRVEAIEKKMDSLDKFKFIIFVGMLGAFCTSLWNLVIK